MKTQLRIVLRAWYRFDASEWLEVRRSGYLTIRLPNEPFMLDAFFDPGLPEDYERPATVVFRGYLFDSPSPEILAVLRGDVPRLEDMLEATEDGLGVFPDTFGTYLKVGSSAPFQAA